MKVEALRHRIQKRRPENVSRAMEERMCKSLLAIEAAVTTLVTMIIFAPSASAYIDPSTGSYIVQLGFGAFFAILMSVRSFVRSFSTIISRIQN